jgi:hypothetical protein
MVTVGGGTVSGTLEMRDLVDRLGEGKADMLSRRAMDR